MPADFLQSLFQQISPEKESQVESYIKHDQFVLSLIGQRMDDKPCLVQICVNSLIQTSNQSYEHLQIFNRSPWLLENNDTLRAIVRVLLC